MGREDIRLSKVDAENDIVMIGGDDREPTTVHNTVLTLCLSSAAISSSIELETMSEISDVHFPLRAVLNTIPMLPIEDDVFESRYILERLFYEAQHLFIHS